MNYAPKYVRSIEEIREALLKPDYVRITSANILRSHDGPLESYRREMIFRVRYQTLDHVPHVYCALFVAKEPDQTFALCGTFTVRKEEFAPLQEAFAKVDFVREEWDED